ncbi:chaperone NapD [Luteimonas granuli]|uniref:Chaperone NapD n=1 Tax=Luteimonas granuli TaxID=1176533 RepID=A0A518N5M0_9GAMM|nr:chaperone NapD [Luteimonas granuli]QDW67188.1 nitrate reductase formation protein NapD [Luteimonas granuli]
MKPDAARREWHLASLVVRHHPEALPALAEAVDAAEGLEIALQDETRSVLVQESDGTAGLMANIDMLHALPGVVTVNLVYHHIEPQEPTG